ncbi:hypothetical protein I317_02108 [Kwoniella heveanensis CBS 569]|nr:hypothetical protein I317_02108 [Kwoniella heveanensis CBS 569]
MVIIKPLAGLSLLFAIGTNLQAVQGAGSLIRLGLGNEIEYFDGTGDVFENPCKGPNIKPINFASADDKQAVEFRLIIHNNQFEPQEWTRKTRRWLIHAVAGSWIRDREDHQLDVNVTHPSDRQTQSQWLWPAGEDAGNLKLGVWATNVTCLLDEDECWEKVPELGEELVCP